MEGGNQTIVSEFILLGLTDDPKLQIILFVLLLLVYIITLMGNIGIIVLTATNSHLQTPMYFFLSNLSFSDLCYSSAITPNTLHHFLAARKSISFIGCATQMYFFVAFATTENFLLGVMAYDRYVAICNPLLYPVIMNKRVCNQLAAGAYVGGLLQSCIQTGCTFHLVFCRSNVINHFFCDIPPLFHLSCTDISINIIVIFIFGGLATLICFFTIIISYVYILTTILRIHSAMGRRKAFNTCVSHFICVTIFYGTVIFMYFRPNSSSYALDQDRVASVFYSVVIPMLNPLIYSLRNKEVINALKKALLKYRRPSDINLEEPKNINK
ncbi:olfactory receptor-like protein OLF1 [Rhinatrema bivittatum]|uniref:olfactory receptor-like protein OLF1 n=1 Tax=Rhinatrema bivittatum TaxID=194408 RepID=UPI001129D242|nr:olfactory receptor-like protein OLF1 [Rhinatrema bivittatum]